MGEEKPGEILRVSGSTPAEKLGSAIAHHVYAGKRVILRAVGAPAINQAMKAVAIADHHTAPRGMRLAVRPEFVDVVMPDKTVTGMEFPVLVS
jgi:stage V sporulation protein S